MKKYISLGVSIMLFALPVSVSAQTVQTNTSLEASLTAALTQLVQVLEQELQLLLEQSGSPSSPSQTQSCSFDNQSVASGSSVLAYQSPSASAGQSCQSQMRICSNGNLSGSFAYPSCTTQQITNICPSYQPAACINGTLVPQGNDANGCLLPPKCVTNTVVVCPMYTLAVCPVGTMRGPGTTDTNGCNVPGSCVPDATTPSITVTTPSGGQSIMQGSALSISWNSQNAPAGSAVAIYIVPTSSTASANSFPYFLQSGLPTSGSFSFQTPPASGFCASGGTPAYCGSSLYATGPSYQIVAKLYTPSTAMFQGTNIVPTPTYLASANSNTFTIITSSSAGVY